MLSSDRRPAAMLSRACSRFTEPMPSSSKAPRPLWFRLLRGVLLVLVVVLLLPYLIVPLYRFIDPVSTLMLWRWATGARVVRTVVPIERVAPVLPATVIASEDGQFCRHRGIDWRELRAVLERSD